MIEKNKTYELIYLPQGHEPIGMEWVYKLKKDAKENTIKHKTRIVLKSYMQ